MKLRPVDQSGYIWLSGYVLVMFGNLVINLVNLVKSGNLVMWPGSAAW